MNAPLIWSTSPIQNQTVDPRAQFPENQPANSLNNGIRGLMASAALARDDGTGALVATLGTGNVYAVTTNQGMLDPTTTAGGQAGRITKPFLLRLAFGTALSGVSAAAPHLKVDGFDCGPILLNDGSAPADGDLLTGIPYEILGDMAVSGDTAVTRVRVLDILPSGLKAILKRIGGLGAPVGTLMQRPGRGILLPDGYLLANGALVSRTTYADLWAYAQAESFVTSEASWPGNTPAFSSGDGSTTFRIPDLRGEFLRGLDLGRGVDSGRDPAVVQADAFRSHQHQTVTDPGLFFIGGGLQVFQNGAGQGSFANTWSTGATGGSETRPRNVAAPIFIKY